MDWVWVGAHIGGAYCGRGLCRGGSCTTDQIRMRVWVEARRGLGLLRRVPIGLSCAGWRWEVVAGVAVEHRIRSG